MSVLRTSIRPFIQSLILVSTLDSEHDLEGKNEL